MIDKTESNIKYLAGKIVYAPNGFGKTQFSLFVENHFNLMDKKVAVFTSKRLNELISISEDKLYFGEAASLNKRRNELVHILDENNSIYGLIKEKYGNLSNYKKTLSAKIFFKSLTTKVDDYLYFLENTDFDKYTENNLQDFHVFDLALDQSIYKRALDLVDRLPDYIDDFFYTNVVSSEIKDSLEKLKNFIIQKRLSKCPLCGNEFDGYGSLIKNVIDSTNKYQSEGKISLQSKVESLYSDITTAIGKSDCLMKYFNRFKWFNSETTDLIIEYIKLCDLVLSNFIMEILNLRISDFYIKDFIFELRESNKQINKIVKEYKNNIALEDYLNKNIKNLIYFRTNIQVSFNRNNLSLSLLDENGKTLNLYESLAESEIKRIALIVLDALIQFNNYDVLILDDPIDSYDDYYLGVACEYISRIIKLCRQKNKTWYLLTNNIKCLMNLSNYDEYECLIFNDNPDILFRHPRKDTVCYSFKSPKLELINCNELVLMAKYLNNAVKTKKIKQSDFSNDDLPFLAFAVTLRNFRDVVTDKYNEIRVDGSFRNSVSENVEHEFMHYDPFPIAGHKKSKDLKMNELFMIYNKIISVSNKNVTKYAFDYNEVVSRRTNCLLKPMRARTGNKFLNLILFKVLAMSEIRFWFETKLIDTLNLSYSFSHSQIESIIFQHGLGKKLNKAEKIAKSKPAALAFVKRGERIFNNYKSIINDFDHAFNLMFPPYLSVSIIDMKRIVDDIIKW